MPMYTLRYSSNNSGGDWWLTDDDWRAMEAAGWKVDWYADSPIFAPDENGRWLEALASKAEIQTDDPKKTIEEWAALVDEDPTDEGCNCCGQPHNFSYTDAGGKIHYVDIDRGPGTLSFPNDDIITTAEEIKGALS
jgi:hypothetical protein